MSSFLQFAIIGVGVGCAYALFAQGIVLVYRGSGLVNFAHGGLGTLSGYVTFVACQQDAGFNVGVSIIIGVASAVVIGLIFQVVILRRLGKAAPLTRIVATLGLLAVIVDYVQLQYGSGFQSVEPFLPHRTLDWGGIRVEEQLIFIAGVTALITLLLWITTRFSRIGLAITAIATNERATQTFGWSPNAISLLTWGVGSGIGAIAGILVSPLTGLSPLEFTLLMTVAALAAALLGGFRSFPLTLIGGLVVGVGQSLVTLYGSNIQQFFHLGQVQGLDEAVPFAVILLVLVVRGRSLPLRSHMTDRLPRLGSGQVNIKGLLLAAGVLLVLLFTVVNNIWAEATYVSLSAAIVVLSVVVLTGYAGQLSLGQWAVAGVGALFAASLVLHARWPMELAIPAGVLLTIPVGVIFALPALRTRGVNLAVLTLGLGFVVSQVVFTNGSWISSGFLGGTPIGSAKLFGVAVDGATHPQRWAAVCLIAFVSAGLLVANLRRSRTGKRLIAVRANERAAASLGISIFGVKLYAFGLAAAIAGLGGILTGFSNSIVTYQNFDTFTSLKTVGNAVIGGLGYIVGTAIYAPMAVDGGLGTRFMDNVVGLSDDLAGVIGSVLILVILLMNQDGLAAITRQLGPLLRRLHLSSRSVTTLELDFDVDLGELPTPVVLEVRDLVVRFGGVTAVSDVGFTLRPGEIVGLIGPNGAGKTSIIDAITGFVRTSSGDISLNGRSIDRWTATRRARQGVRRSFQSLELFDDMTVEENIGAGSELGSRLSWITDLFHPGRHPLSRTAVSAISEFGLSADLGKLPTELPYARRRLVAIARSVASGPAILLLDEPAAGLDDLESKDIARLIRRLAEQRNIGVLLVEHDMDLVMSTCDRIVVLEYGRVIAHGTPSEIRESPSVRAAYLGHPMGTEETAVMASAGDSIVLSTPTTVAVRPSQTLLECRELSVGYGEMPVVREINLRVEAGEVVALIGPNGTGKTTTLLAVAGELQPMSGEILWRGDRTTEPVYRRARRGLGYVTQERSAIMNLSVAENLRLADVDPAEAFGLFPALATLRDREAGVLSGGEQQMLALARQLGRHPALLLADELSFGLAPLVVRSLLHAVRTAAVERGIGVLFVEQHVQLALETADRVYLMRRGRIVLEGNAAEVRDQLGEVERAYLAAID